MWWADEIRPDQVVKVIEDAFPEVRTAYFGNAPRIAPGRLRPVLDGCRRFFLGADGEDWCVVHPDGSWARATGLSGGRR